MDNSQTDPRYLGSNQMLERALRVIPMGSQTFSKSHIQYPAGHAPLFLIHGHGGRVWDVDGNEYVDMVCSLLAVMLGYNDQDVNAAIAEQLQRGITFSMATELEIRVAEMLVDTFPCAEMVRFGKNGSDATSAAVRVARAFTKRERLAVCGYHGWQDWYIGSTVRNHGVPQAVCELTHRFPYNDLAALETLLSSRPREFAAVIMEPVGAAEPTTGYLEGVRDLAHMHGTLLIFDEVITGLRVAPGGAQEYYGVIPDLASVGKSLGNGMPISAVLGRADIMHLFEDVFFSGTFGGETLSLAAAAAVLDKCKRESVTQRLWRTGRKLADGFKARVMASGLGEIVSLSGLPPWQVIQFRDHPNARKEAIKTLFIREMLNNGVLINSSLNVCHAHDEGDVRQVLAALDVALTRLALELQTEGLEGRLGCAVVMPVFSVR